MGSVLDLWHRGSLSHTLLTKLIFHRIIVSRFVYVSLENLFFLNCWLLVKPFHRTVLQGHTSDVFKIWWLAFYFKFFVNSALICEFHSAYRRF